MQQKDEDKGSPCRYKLTYFNLRGRGELPRLIFAAAGVPFEDKRIQFGKEWEEFKPKTPHGYMPLLEFDGKTLDQSQTISRFLSKEFDLHGDDNWQQAQVETCMDMCLDLFLQAVKVHYEKDEERKLSTADLALYEIMTMFKDHDLGQKCPTLGTHFQLIGNLPRIKKYVAKRPVTQG